MKLECEIRDGVRVIFLVCSITGSVTGSNNLDRVEKKQILERLEEKWNF